MSRKSKNAFVADFETSNREDDCRVWAWATANIFNQDEITYGTNIEGYLDHIKKLPNATKVYFHNLKFDGQFIANKLLKMGYKFAKVETDNYKEGYFGFTISKDQGVWYSGFVNFKNGNRIQFVDSLKKIPFKVKEIAVAFNLDILKGDLDYNTFRSKTHKLTKKEKKYLFGDVKIIAEALKIQFDEGLTANTISSDSLKDLQSTIGKGRFDSLFPKLSNEMYYNLKLAYRGGQTYVNKIHQNKLIGEGIVFDINSQYPWAMHDKPMPFGLPIFFEGQYEYNKTFPLYIQHVRCAFKIKEKHIPTIQIKNNPFFKANEFLENSGDFEQVDLYLTNIDYGLFMEHYDVYNLEYIDGYMFKSIIGVFNKYIDKYMIIKKTSKGSIRSIAKLKLNSIYGKFGSDPEVTGKIIYLKEDGSNGFRQADRVYYEDENGRLRSHEEKSLKHYADSVYIPVAIFTTSYGRELTVRTAQKVYDRFCYCDTDSIHLIGTDIPEEIKDIIHPSDLGCWKHESTFKRAKFVRQKTYIEETYCKYIYDDEGNNILDRFGKKVFDECEKEESEFVHLNVKCAGMPDNIKQYVTFKNFDVGNTIKAPTYNYKGVISKGIEPKDKLTFVYTMKKPNDKKLVPKQVSGGVVLTEQEFTIKNGALFGFK